MNQMAKRYLPQCIAIVLLAFAFNPDNPYGYYIFLRFSIFLIALYLIAVQAVKLEIEYFLYVLIGVVIIYNPFITVHLGRDIWGIVNIFTIILFIYSMWLWRTKNNNTKGQVDSNFVANRKISISTKKPDTSYIEFNANIESLNDYKSAVEHYISWANHLEALYITRAVDDDFESLEKQVVSNSYRTGESYKVTGLLIVDAIREFKANHRDGVNFLSNLNESLLEELGGNSEEQLGDDYSESVDDEEIQYYEAVNDFINSHGFYEPLLELQGTDKEYCIASMKMHKAGYLSRQSEKVVGALTLDSIKQYEQNRQLAILFLENLEQDFLNEENESSDDYHPALDKAVSEAEKFLESNNMYVPLRGNGAALNVTSELFVYISSYLAMLSSGKNIAAMSWNSFKSSIENRILATIENPPSLSDSIVTPESTTFVHYTSEYFTEMTRMEEMVLNNKDESGNFNLQPLIAYFLRTLGSGSSEHQSQLQAYLSEVSDFASQEIIPKVVRVFG